MSDTQTVWMLLWRRALKSSNPRDPFEISDVVPDVVEALKVPEREAARLVRNLLTALEQTVVSTAMPSIIAALKGLEIYPWVFSAYLLSSTVMTPIYGKLADLFGRKRVLLFGLGLFMLGSILSGLAQSMPQLIATRV